MPTTCTPTMTRRLSRLVLACAAGGLAGAAAAQEAAAPDLAPLAQQIQEIARQAQGPQQARVQVEVGQLDPRLRLAPCRKIEPYLPPGLPAWGRTRVGLRCVDGPKAWNVSLPVTVHVWAPALVASAALPAGTVLEARHLSLAEADIAAGTGRTFTVNTEALGRTLARALPAGSPLRQTDLKARQWFAAGETVRVVAVGPGWRIHGEGEALTPGLEGQIAKVRTENGRVIQGRPVADREMEVSL